MLSLRPPTRVELLFCLIAVLTMSSVWLTRAQQPAGANDQDNFTGRSFRLESKGYGLSRRGFDAAARSNWHTHDGGQLLFVEEGKMRVQIEGQAMKEVGKGESVFLPGGVAHWHGAIPAQALTQLSVTFGPGIKWMEHVTDAQYAGRAKR